MASKAWSDRSGDERKGTFTRFLIIYAIITLAAVAFSWWLIAITFGLITVALLVATLVTDGETPGRTTDDDAPGGRPIPEWMKNVELPDLNPQPDLPSTPDTAPFDPPPHAPDTAPFDPPPHAPPSDPS